MKNYIFKFFVSLGFILLGLSLFLLYSKVANQSPTYFKDKVKDNIFAIVEVSSGIVATGFILKGPDESFFVTAGHVCRKIDENPHKYFLFNRNIMRIIEQKSNIISTTSDVCLMKAPFQTTQGFYMQNPELPEAQDAWIVGFPFGQPLTATFGSIVGKMVFLVGDAKVVMSISGIATNIPIAPGSSGSPILDADGDVVSIAIALNQNIPAGFSMGIDKTNFISELNQLINIQTSLNK